MLEEVYFRYVGEHSRRQGLLGESRVDTSGRVQSGHDPEPREERGEGKEEEREGKQVQQSGGPKRAE